MTVIESMHVCMKTKGITSNIHDGARYTPVSVFVYVSGTRVNNIIIRKGILYEAHACQKRVCCSPRAQKTLCIIYI